MLLNKFRGEKTDENKHVNSKQINFSVGLVGKAKKDFFNSLNVKYITDHKTFNE